MDFNGEKLDYNQRQAKFYEKIGSTTFSFIFLALFWVYAKKIEYGETCYASKTSESVVLPSAAGAEEVNAGF